jgi:ribonuclease P protein component
MRMEKAYRVKKNTEIEKIIRKKESVGDGFFVIYKAENLRTGHFRFAVSVSKKYGIAVERNRIKRQVREIVAVAPFQPRFDFLIVVKNNAKKLEFNEMQLVLNKLFARAKIIEVEQ